MSDVKSMNDVRYVANTYILKFYYKLGNLLIFIKIKYDLFLEERISRFHRILYGVISDNS